MVTGAEFISPDGRTRQHGTVSGYKNGGCRCAECGAARAAYDRAYKRRRRMVERGELPPQQRPDGTTFVRLIPEPLPTEVREQAACKGYPTEWWFPGKHVSGFNGEKTATVARALAICEGCPVSGACLDYAVRVGEQGIWGGTFGKERRAIRVERNKTKGLRDGSSPGTALPDADPSPAAVPAPPPGSSTARWPRLGGHHFHGDRIA